MSCLPFWSVVEMHIFFFETDDRDKLYRAEYSHEAVHKFSFYVAPLK